ncbi:MAG: hypothetical protein ACK4ND_12920 [Cytophagaceae bacterium]
MKLLLYFSFFILLTSCGMSKNKYSDNELAQILKNKYNKDFIIEENYFHFQLNHHKFVAILKETKEVKVFGSYKDNTSDIRDNYPQMLNNYQAKEWINELLNPYYDKFAVRVNVLADVQEMTHGEIISFKDIISSKDTDALVFYHIYLFDTINEENKSYLKGIVDISNFFKENFFGKYTFNVFFWSNEILKGKKFDQMKFGFNYHREDYDDNLEAKNQLLKQELVFEFDTHKKPEITIDKLYTYIKPYNEGPNIGPAILE